MVPADAESDYGILRDSVKGDAMLGTEWVGAREGDTINYIRIHTGKPTLSAEQGGFDPTNLRLTGAKLQAYDHARIAKAHTRGY